jgi:hypothetical protein
MMNLNGTERRGRVVIALVLRTRQVPVSSVGPETGYPGWGFRGFPQSLQANAGIVPSN